MTFGLQSSAFGHVIFNNIRDSIVYDNIQMCKSLEKNISCYKKFQEVYRKSSYMTNEEIESSDNFIRSLIRISQYQCANDYQVLMYLQHRPNHDCYVLAIEDHELLRELLRGEFIQFDNFDTKFMSKHCKYFTEFGHRITSRLNQCANNTEYAIMTDHFNIILDEYGCNKLLGKITFKYSVNLKLENIH